TAMMRLFSNDTMGVGSDYKGWYNYLEAPLFYCGLINLLLVPQLFGFLSKRKKIVFLSFIALFILPVIFPYLRYMFWGFTGDYYRLFSLFLPFTLLLYSVSVLSRTEKKGRINLVTLSVTVALLLVILFYNYFSGAEVINDTRRNAVVLFLLVYAVLLYFFNVKRVVNVAKTITLAFIIVELISFSSTTVNDRPVITGEEMKQKTGYNDYTVDAVNYLKSVDKGFYRIVKEYSSGPAIHSSINDAQVQNFYSTSSYTSFNQKNYIKFLGEADIIDETDETQTRWASGVTQTPILHSFASVKYTLSKRPQPFIADYNYDLLTTVGDVKILKNRSPLPLGFGYSRFIIKNDYNLLSYNQKKLILNRAVVLDDSVYGIPPGLTKFQLNDTSGNYTWAEFNSDIDLLKEDTLQIEMFSQNYIKGKISLEQPKLLFFSIPFDGGWKIKIDKRDVEPIMVNMGFTGLSLEKGDHQVELTFIPRFYNIGTLGSVAGLILFFLIIGSRYLFAKRREAKEKPERNGQADIA
ncbi:MAG TPA: YfhO family protein, partial [Chitinophagaceae bacterium]|nr:YfhO family protein [Chitinophagaceae bacterium]